MGGCDVGCGAVGGGVVVFALRMICPGRFEGHDGTKHARVSRGVGGWDGAAVVVVIAVVIVPYIPIVHCMGGVVVRG